MDNRKSNGQFGKGNKAGGRKVGSKNKTSEKIRTTYLSFIEYNLETLQDDFDTLEPKERFKVLLELTRFVLPTLKAVEFGNVLDELSETDFQILVGKLKEEYNLN